MRWQLNLYKDIAMRSEGPPDPDRVVDRIQRISAAVFNLEQVSRWNLNVFQTQRSDICVSNRYKLKTEESLPGVKLYRSEDFHCFNLC